MIFDESQLAALLEGVVRKVLREELAGGAGTSEEYLSVAVAARVAEVSPNTIRGWVAEGKLSRHKAGREIRVLNSELHALLRSPVESRAAEAPEALARRAFGKANEPEAKL